MESPTRTTSFPRLLGLLGLLGVIFGGVGLFLAGCGPRDIADMDEVYFSWDQRQVLCGVSVDDDLSKNFLSDLDNLRKGMERALARGEVLILYAHKPGDDISLERLESVLALGNELGLPFFTFDELHGPPLGAGVALTFDDAYIDAWHGQRALFDAYGARVTFFVTRFYKLSTTRIEQLHELHTDGHAIESHGHNHRNAPDYVEEHGLHAYVDDEVVPSLEAMRAEGFTPTTFAYPYGARTSELDHAILEHVALVRSISWLHPSPLVADPCPE